MAQKHPQTTAMEEDRYYFLLRLELSGYDHVVYSDMSCDWRGEISAARTCARQIAEALALNGEKAEALAILKGRALLPFGPAGTAYIRELAAREGIPFDEQALCLAIARDALAGDLRRMTDDLHGAILALYQESEQGEAQQESRIVAAVYNMLRDYALLRQNDAMAEEQWQEECRAVAKASAQAGKLLPFTAISQLAKPYAEAALPPLPGAEREYLDVLWAHYKAGGAQGVELIRQVTAAYNQGEQVADIRRLGRKTADGRRIETYAGQEAPTEFRLKIHNEEEKWDIVHDEETSFSAQQDFPLRLGGQACMDSLHIDIVELLGAGGEFVGAALDISLPSDARSLARDKRRVTLLVGQKKAYGYGGGNDDFSISCGFTVTIEKGAALTPAPPAADPA